MTVISVAVKHLVSLGMRGDELADAIAEMQAAEDTRSVGAKRQQRYRDRAKERNESSQSVTCYDSVTPPSLDKESFPQTPFKEINPIPVCEPRARGPVKFVLPDDIPAEQWSGFVEMRRGIRKPMSARAMGLAVVKLRRLRDEDGWPPGQVLDHCTLNSYQGIFPPKHEGKNGNDGYGRRGGNQGSGKVDGFTAALREIQSNSEAGNSHAENSRPMPRIASMGGGRAG